MIKANIRKAYLTLADITIINLTFLLSLFLHYEGHIPDGMITTYLQSAIILTAVKILIYRYFQLYNSIWEYASIEELMKVVMAVTVGCVISSAYLWFINYELYLGVYLFMYALEVGAIGGVRFGYRLIRRLKHRQTIIRMKNTNKHVLIVGSGSTATLIAREIKNHPEAHGEVVGYIDDDKSKHNKIIAGTKILGDRYDIRSVVKHYHVEEIILAVPTATPQDIKAIVEECKSSEAEVKIMPGVQEIIDGNVSLSKIRDVQIEDLLGRDPVDLNVTEIAGYIEDKVVLVTGGGGSIGSELCRQIARFEPKQLVILDIYENNAYDIQNELGRRFPNLNLDVIIASVRDRENVFNIMESIRPDVIFHAAAHKHVPLMERTPKEAIKNNTFGTMNVADAACQYQVERFVLISTDKAVNPTNIMGASKRMCEMVIQGIAKTCHTTKFVAVRFGNVLGSNGSVIPLFKSQIEEGGPVTVTHKEIIRYFMTIPEAAQLVIQAGAIANGGEVFVLDMGEPVKIYDLAVDLIKLSGLKPHEDIEIQITGLRPGEKLFEELLMEEEGLQETKYDKIHVGAPGETDYKVLKKSFKELDRLIRVGSNEDVVDMVQHIVPTYKDNKEVNKGNGHKTEGIGRYRLLEN